MSFPFFLSTTTIGDSQVASSTCLIKLATSNLLISCLTWLHSWNLTNTLLDEQVVSMCPTQADVELHHVVFP